MSNSGAYHTILRGINRQSIFEGDEDRTRFLEIISEIKDLSEFKLPGYCLIDNRNYISQSKGPADTSDILRIFSTNTSKAIEQFNEFMRIEADGMFLDEDSASKRSDDAYRERMCVYFEAIWGICDFAWSNAFVRFSSFAES
jgi:hypothetical protein